MRLVTLRDGDLQHAAGLPLAAAPASPSTPVPACDLTLRRGSRPAALRRLFRQSRAGRGAGSSFRKPGPFPPRESRRPLVERRGRSGRVTDLTRGDPEKEVTSEASASGGASGEHDEAMAPRRLLLVGEGNFSFAAALSETLGPSTSVTATCLQGPADSARDPAARRNLQRLREQGIEVRFGVDCTQLADAFELHDREFDRIYFNFPHCGRKAGVAKNRELLAKFFQSCADVLAEEGEIHVTLCRGQGGTPADKPMREWHNSWQVVAMAARGGFILSDVHPFSCEAVPGYKCTGYRSQAKSFHVEGALNHIFTQSLPFKGSQPKIFKIRLDDQWFSFPEPEGLAGKLNRGFLEAPSSHPIRTINEKLISELGKAFPLKRLKCSFPLLPQGPTSVLTHWNCDILSAAFWISLCEDNSNSESLPGGTRQDMEDFLVSFSELSLPEAPGRDSKEEAHKGTYDQAKVCLRPSLLVHVQTVIQAPDFLPGSLHVLSGPVFRKCHILPFRMPAFHETLLILGFNKNLKDGSLQSLLDHLKGILESLLTQISLEGSKLSSSSVEFVFQPNGKDYMINVKSHNFGPGCAKDLLIGSITTSVPSIVNKDQCFVFVSMNLDLLAMLVWAISDWRMLWTFDNRFLKNFIPGKIEPFKSYSLYPPCYAHDISFWIDEEKGFDELEFHTMARAVSQDTVTSIQFLSCFQHPKTEQVSLCYRLTYQTCDKALTRQQVASMQSQFRKEIQQRLHVTVR